MLDEIRQSYRESADAIPDWKNKSVNDLCFEYLDCIESLKDNYISAIICKTWGLFTKTYYSQGVKLASPEDCYNWLVDSIQYVLIHHVWTDLKHSLYNDPKAPEKAINVVFTSTKINYFVALTRQKRRVDTQALSLESISDGTSDAYFLPVYDNYYLFESELSKTITDLYKGYHYFDSICLDLIVSENLIDKDSDINLKYKKLQYRLKNLDDDYARFFSANYGLNFEDVLRSVTYISNLNLNEIHLKIVTFINSLKRSPVISSILK